MESRFLRYIDTKNNGEGLKKCILNGSYEPTSVLIQVVPAAEGRPAVQQHTAIETVLNMTPENKEHFQSEKEAIFLLLTGIGDEIYSTVDACNTANEMWIAIERLQQVYFSEMENPWSRITSRFYKLMNELTRNNLQVTTMQVNVQFLQQLQPEWSRFVTIVKQAEKIDIVSYHRLFDILKQFQLEVNDIRAERIAKSANPLALIAAAQPYSDTYYQAPKPQRSNATSSSTRQSASTRHKGKEVAKPITPQSESVSEEDSDPEQAQRDKEMQKNLALLAKYFKKLYKPTNNNLRTSSNSRNKTEDTTPRSHMHTSDLRKKICPKREGDHDFLIPPLWRYLYQLERGKESVRAPRSSQDKKASDYDNSARAPRNVVHTAEKTNSFTTRVSKLWNNNNDQATNCIVSQEADFFNPFYTRVQEIETSYVESTMPVQQDDSLPQILNCVRFALTVSIVEPKNIKEAMADYAWIKAMQDELHQFDRLKSRLVFATKYDLVAKGYARMWITSPQRLSASSYVSVLRYLARQHQKAPQGALQSLIHARCIDTRKAICEVNVPWLISYKLDVKENKTDCNVSAEQSMWRLSASCAHSNVDEDTASRLWLQHTQYTVDCGLSVRNRYIHATPCTFTDKAIPYSVSFIKNNILSEDWDMRCLTPADLEVLTNETA
ncbi:hypothetical protein Tco_0528504 [Tanacetum coccineum]